MTEATEQTDKKSTGKHTAQTPPIVPPTPPETPVDKMPTDGVIIKTAGVKIGDKPNDAPPPAPDAQQSAPVKTRRQVLDAMPLHEWVDRAEKEIRAHQYKVAMSNMGTDYLKAHDDYIRAANADDTTDAEFAELTKVLLEARAPLMEKDYRGELVSQYADKLKGIPMPPPVVDNDLSPLAIARRAFKR